MLDDLREAWSEGRMLSSRLALTTAVLLLAACSAGTTCPLGQQLCDSRCVSLESDNAACGACGKACAAGSSCQSGACVTATTACPAGEVLCGSACVDPATDVRYCGASASCQGATAGAACSSGQRCVAGACAVSCLPTQVLCGGECVDPATDARFCGASAECLAAHAGVSCPTGERCAAGACTASCPAGSTVCPAVGSAAAFCAQLQSDPAHCGACGTACAAGQSCQSGGCVDTCTGAGKALCTGGCVDTRSDNLNCGACGHGCPAGSVCTSGACALSCGSGQTSCGTAPAASCHDLSSDPSNCGTCGHACTGSANSVPVCANGTCNSVCPAGFGDCDAVSTNGCEINLVSSAAHCGACGTACPAPANSQPTCAGSSCGSTCKPGFADCNNNPADGCEAVTTGDPLNCGVCGKACPAGAHQAATCSGSSCGVQCAPLFGDCDNNPVNGCEADLSSSSTSCGACNAPCTGVNATASCVLGQCNLMCSPGYADCDHAAGNGCETVLVNDPANCGSCGFACSAGPHSTATCGAGSCGLLCASNFSDCDNNPATGCEVALASDLLNCGACGHACSTNNSSPACMAGNCVAHCTAGFKDCDGNGNNGCEVNTNTNAANCGSCSNLCSPGKTCIAGACV